MKKRKTILIALNRQGRVQDMWPCFLHKDDKACARSEGLILKKATISYIPPTKSERLLSMKREGL